MHRDELKPCPFCGGEAERVDIEDGDNAGGSFVHCTVCDASGNVEFGFKENFISNWNRRAANDLSSTSEIIAGLRHAASDRSDMLQKTAAIDAAIAFLYSVPAALSIEQTKPETASTPAPPHTLPSWGECALAVSNYEFRMRAKAGLEGAVLDTEEPPEPTALIRFIHEYDDSDAYKSAWFMHRLDLVVIEARSALVNAQADADVVERWQPIETAPRDWTDVLLYLPDEDDGTGARGVVKGWFSMKDGGFDCWFGCGINSESNVDPCNPTHWMPLPAPPALSSLRPAEVGSATSSIGGDQS